MTPGTAATLDRAAPAAYACPPSVLLGLVGALLCGLAPGIWPLIAGRFFLGLSAAFVMPATLGLVKAYYSDADRPRAISYWSMSTGGCASISSFCGKS